MTRTRAAAISIAVLTASVPVIGWAPVERALARVQARPQVTFAADIAPILFSECASCHRPAGIAPFSLLTYDDARDHAAAILEATEDRVMPPWKPEPGYGEFVDERRLTRAQIDTIRRWVAGGLVEGDPALLPRPPTWNGEWQLGKPDLVLETAPYTLRASGEDIYRNFVLPVEAGMASWPSVRVSAAQAHRLGRGQGLRGPYQPLGRQVAVLDEHGRGLGLGEVDGEGGLRPSRLFRWAAATGEAAASPSV